MLYRLTEAAELDVLDIYLYGYQAFGQQQADIYHDVLEKTFEFLALNPYAGSKRPELDVRMMAEPIWIHPVRSHLVVYTIGNDKTVCIVRVRHAHEDWL